MTEIIYEQRDFTDVAGLVSDALRGEQRAWQALVERYSPLVGGITRKYRLSAHDAEDVSQTLWLTLVDHLGKIREPRALPGWICTTTRNLALGIIASHRRTVEVDPIEPVSVLVNEANTGTEVDERLLRAERLVAVRAGLDELSEENRKLLLLVVQDPPLTYQEIGRQLDMPVGSIGPSRARCLAKLRSTMAMQSIYGE